MQFRSCVGRNACRDDATGENCLTCGRSMAEVLATRAAVEQVSSLVLEQGYENVDEFLSWLTRKVTRKVAHVRRENPAGDTTGTV